MKKTREIFLIFGKTGSGKTELAKKLSKNYSRKIVFDSLAEYREGIIFYCYEDFRHYIKNNYYETKSFSYILRFNRDEDFELAFELLYHLENYVLILEEAELYISPYVKKSYFLSIVRYGRHNKISIIGIARQVTELSFTMRSQVNKIYTFKQTDPRDIKTMENLGVYNVEKLKEFEYIEKEY